MRDAVLENEKKGNPSRYFCLVIAAWIRMLIGNDEKGNKIKIKDPNWTHLSSISQDMFRNKAEQMVNPTAYTIKSKLNIKKCECLLTGSATNHRSCIW